MIPLSVIQGVLGNRLVQIGLAAGAVWAIMYFGQVVPLKSQLEATSHDRDMALTQLGAMQAANAQLEASVERQNAAVQQVAQTCSEKVEQANSAARAVLARRQAPVKPALSLADLETQWNAQR